LTDFENAAFVVFVVILTRAILFYGLDFRMPISKMREVTQKERQYFNFICIKQVDENMKRAVKCDAVNKEQFHFRKVIIPVLLPHYWLTLHVA